MTNSVDPDQTAPGLGPPCMLIYLKLVSNVRQLFAADVFRRLHFSDAFFLGTLWVNDDSCNGG